MPPKIHDTVDGLYTEVYREAMKNLKEHPNRTEYMEYYCTIPSFGINVGSIQSQYNIGIPDDENIITVFCLVPNIDSEKVVSNLQPYDISA